MNSDHLSDHLSADALRSSWTDRPLPATPASGDVPLRRPRDGRRSSRDRDATAVPQSRSAGTPPHGSTGPIRQLLGPVTGSLRLGIARNDGATEQQLRVDWPQCKAHGLCAEIAPEIIHLDEWGYPVFKRSTVASADLATARKAVQVCPTLALRLVGLPPKG